jgi:hypothetical protein
MEIGSMTASDKELVKTLLNVDGFIVNPGDVTVPTDRKFRSAWTLSGDVVVIDIEKAKDIWKRNMRAARVERFASLDAQYFRALEIGDEKKKSEIAMIKQLLRDVTNLEELQNANTVEEVEAVWPLYLDE